MTNRENVKSVVDAINVIFSKIEVDTRLVLVDDVAEHTKNFFDWPNDDDTKIVIDTTAFVPFNYTTSEGLDIQPDGSVVVYSTESDDTDEFSSLDALLANLIHFHLYQTTAPRG